MEDEEGWVEEEDEVCNNELFLETNETEVEAKEEEIGAFPEWEEEEEEA